jgi:MFS transporter, DHA1 family, solute carrier family 18 (vesicular amine transporter), member 1/2
VSPSPDIPRRTLIFWTVTLLIGVDTILFSMVAPALPEFADRYDFSASVAALIFAVFPLGQLLSALLAAGLVERVGRRPVMMIAAVVLLLATLGFAIATGPGLLALARFMQGAAAGLVWTAGLAAISDVYPVDQLGFRLGLAETAGGAMGLLGPILGGALIVVVGLDATFALAAILPALALIPVFLIPETRRGPGVAQRLGPAMRNLLRVPKARVAFWALAGVAAVLALVEPLLPLDLADRLDLSSLGIGIVFGVGLLSYFALVPVGGRWSDRRGRRAPLIVGGVLMAAGLPFIAVGPAVTVAIAFAVVGAGMAAMGAPTGPLMVEAVDEAGMTGQYGLSSAMLTVVFAVGYAVGPLLGAGASAVMPFLATMILTSAAIALVAAWVARTLPREQTAREALAAGPRG